MNSTWHEHHLNPATPEGAYDLLTGYAFARRYAAGKTVLDLREGDGGPGVQLLAETAESVTTLTGSGEPVGRTGSPRATLDAGPESAEPLTLPQPDASLDVVVALQVIEHQKSPEELVKEAKRVLKPDGVLIVSTPDKQAHSNERNLPPHLSEMYVQELREVLGRHFGNVSLRRQGSVAGGLVSGASGSLVETPLESVQLSSSAPSPGSGPPPLRLVLAVCSDEELEEDGGPYLLLDRDRRVFEEDEDHREDIELLRDEVRRMQETEVQTFQNTVALRNSEVAYLRSELGISEGPGGPGASPNRIQELKDQNDALKRENDKLKTRLHGVEGSNIWRLTAPYRRGRALLDSWLKGGSREAADGRRVCR